MTKIVTTAQKITGLMTIVKNLPKKIILLSTREKRIFHQDGFTGGVNVGLRYGILAGYFFFPSTTVQLFAISGKLAPKTIIANPGQTAIKGIKPIIDIIVMPKPDSAKINMA